MTVKKAASCCVALGAAIALFGAAAGLSRPTGSVTKQSKETNGLVSVEPRGGAMNPSAAGSLKTTETAASTATPERVQMTPLPGGASTDANAGARGAAASKSRLTPPSERPRASVAKSVTERVRGERPGRPAAQPGQPTAEEQPVRIDEPTTPARTESPKLYRVADGAELPTNSIKAVPAGAWRPESFARARVQDAQGFFPDGSALGTVGACTGDEGTTTFCGEDHFYNKRLEGFFFDVNDGISAAVLDDGIVPALPGAATVNVCGVTVGYVTDSTDLVRIKLRIFQPGHFEDFCEPAIDVSFGQEDREIEWCAPGSPDGTLTAFISTFDLSPVMVLDTQTSFAYQIAIEITDPENNSAGPLITAPGTNILGAAPNFPNVNGNFDCFRDCGSQESCGGAVFFGGFPYAGFYLAMHTRDYQQGNSTPGACDIDSNGIVDMSGPDAVCEGGPLGTANGVVNTGDANQLAALIIRWNGSAVFGTETFACADVDRNGVINCGDWLAFTACFPAAIAVTGAGGEAGTPTSTGPANCNPGNGTTSHGRYRFFSSGPPSALTVPPPEVFAALNTNQANIPDNAVAGITNPRIFPQPSAGASLNGIENLDVDLRIENLSDPLSTFGAIDNGDFVITLIHQTITRTLINRPHNSTTPSLDNGYMVAFDDTNETPFSESPNGLTYPIQHARSNFKVFGRYSPVNPLTPIMLGRKYGRTNSDPTTTDGPGGWRLRARDLATGASGRLISWSVHVDLGPVRAPVPVGNDEFRTLGCRALDSFGSSHVTVGEPVGLDPWSPTGEMAQIPADFFDPGSEPFDGRILVEGDPYQPNVSDADTQWLRTLPVEPTLDGSTGTPISMTRLSLRSCAPIAVSYSDRDWDELWNVHVTLSDTQGVLGQMTLYFNDDGGAGEPGDPTDRSTGGMYWARLAFRPKLVFTQACDATKQRELELAEGMFLETATGEELAGDPDGTVGCNCRVPFVRDPDLLGQALGANPNNIVEPDFDITTIGVIEVHFAPNVTLAPNLAPAEGWFTGLDSFGPTYGLNWWAHGVRAPIRIPSCGSPPAAEKDLPTDLVCGTWGFAPFSFELEDACAPYIGIEPVIGGVFGVTSENKAGFQHHSFDGFLIFNPITVSRVEWWGTYGSPAGAPQDLIDAPDDFVDQFTIEFWKDRTGASPPKPDVTNGASLISQTFVGPGNGRVRTPFFQTDNNAPVYNYSADFAGPTLTPAVGGERFWLTIYNNTELLPPSDNGFSRWRWKVTNDEANEGRRWGVFITEDGSENIFQINYAYCLSQLSEEDAKVYCGDSIVDNTCGQLASGLSFRLQGNPGGSGGILINGVEEKADVLPFVKNRWIDVQAPMKENGFDNRKFPEPLAVNDPLVRQELESVLTASGKNPLDYECELNAIFAALPTTGMVDHVFGGKLHFDHPTGVRGLIEQICRQDPIAGENGPGQEYAGDDVTSNARDVLHNNLDAFGVGLVVGNLLTPDVGQFVMYVKPQEKDCNNNGRLDYLDIREEDGGPCTEGSTPPCSSDCNEDGIPDECQLSGNDCDNDGIPDECEEDCNHNGNPDSCDVPPICTAGPPTCSEDCDSNGVPDECQADCDADDIPDACEIAVSDGGACVGPIGDSCNEPDVCSTDCDADGIPDCCQGVGGEAPVLVAQVGWEEGEGFQVGNLDPLGTGGVGQNGWDTILFGNFGFIGNDIDPLPASGNVAGPASSPACFTTNTLQISQDPNAAPDASFWSWGFRSPILHSDIRVITDCEVDLYIPSTIAGGDTFPILVTDDRLTGSNTIFFGASFLRRDNAQPPGMATWIPGFIQFNGIPFPLDECFTLKISYNSADPRNVAHYFLNNELVTIEAVDVPPPGAAPNPTQFAIGTGNGPSTAWFDNPRFSKASPYNVLLDDCDNDGVRNGCAIRDLVSPDCNCNGSPDECDIESGPFGCVAENGTAAPPQLPNLGPTTRPCSPDCNTDGIPDECQVPSKGVVDGSARTVRMFHDIEDDGDDPTFVGGQPISGQPTDDPLAADDDNDSIADNPSWGVVGGTGFFAPADPFISVATSGVLGPCDGDQAIWLQVDDSDPGTKPTDGSMQYGILGGTFGTIDNLSHLSRQRFSTQMRINPGSTAYEIGVQGQDDTGGGFITTFVRFGRAGIDYPDDVNAAGGAQGALPANEVLVINFTLGAMQRFSPPLLWTPGGCFTLVLETKIGTEACVDPAANLVVGLDYDSDGMIDQSRSADAPASTNMREVFILSDNRIDADPGNNPGDGFFDNVTLLEYDAYDDGAGQPDANDNGIPDDCEAACDCDGDMNGSGVVDGDDIGDFVRCLISGGAGCECQNITVGEFVAKLLTAHPNCP